MPLSEAHSAVLWRANQLAHDVRRFARQEASQGQMSPTDRAFLARLEEFLKRELPEALTGDPEFDITTSGQ